MNAFANVSRGFMRKKECGWVLTSCIQFLAVFAVFTLLIGIHAGVAQEGRVSDGLQVLYTFDEGSGTTVGDTSGVGSPLDLTIDDPSGVDWGNSFMTINGSNETLKITSGEPAAKLFDALTATNEITMEAWIIPSNTTQVGPARVMTYSVDTGNRNFTLGQDGDNYQIRLRTPETGNNGFNPVVDTNDGTLATELTHVVYTRAADGTVNVYLNNENVEISVDTLPGDFSNWDETFEFSLGNEVNGDRFFQGTYFLAAVYNRALTADEVAQNFNAGATEQTLTTAERSFSSNLVFVGDTLDITIAVDNPTTGTLTETFPEGWIASNISIDGTVDGNTIEWTLTPSTTELTYTLTVPDDAETSTFSGSTPTGIDTLGPTSVDLIKSGAGDLEFSGDIGEIEAPGSTEFDGSEFIVRGGGADIWGGADAFHFAFNEFEGPFRMAGNALMGPLDSDSEWVKGGLMVRNNLTPGSSNAFTQMDGSGDNDQLIRWQQRLEQGADSQAGDFFENQFGDMLIERRGKTVITKVLTPDGEEVVLGTHFLSDMEDPVFAGLAVTSHDVGALSELFFTPGLNNFDFIELMNLSAERRFSDSNPSQGSTITVTLAAFSRNTANFTLTETPPEGWTIDNVNTDTGSATLNGDGSITWEATGAEGEVTMTYDLTIPEDVDEGSFDGEMTADGESTDIIGQELDLPPIPDNIGLVALYTFDEGEGTTVGDSSDVGEPLDLTISDPAGVDWGDDTLTINDSNPGLKITSGEPATKLFNNLTPTNEITMEAWVTPSNTTQSGPARIMSYSVDTGNRNFTMGQDADSYQIRLRTPVTGNNGINPYVATDPGTVVTELTHIVYTRAADETANVYLDGESVATSTNTVPGEFTNWNEEYEFSLANEVNGDRFWQGTYDLIAVYNVVLSADQVMERFNAGPDSPITDVSDFMLY